MAHFEKFLWSFNEHHLKLEMKAMQCSARADLGGGIQTCDTGLKLGENNGDIFPGNSIYIRRTAFYWFYEMTRFPHPRKANCIHSLEMGICQFLVYPLGWNLTWAAFVKLSNVSTHYSSASVSESMFLQGSVAKAAVLLTFSDFLVSIPLRRLKWTPTTPVEATCSFPAKSTRPTKTDP